MWTIIGQSGVMNNVVDITAFFVPFVWELLGASVLPTVALVGLALREYRVQPSTQPHEVKAEELQMAA